MSSLPARGLVHALAISVYVGVVVSIMNALSGPDKMMPQWVGPFAILMLLVLSAATVGSLMFLKPVMMYFNGDKQDAVKLLAWTLGWQAALTVVAFAVVLSLIR